MGIFTIPSHFHPSHARCMRVYAMANVGNLGLALVVATPSAAAVLVAVAIGLDGHTHVKPGCVAFADRGLCAAVRADDIQT